MCKQCELKPVYEFTNKRKLCKRCFINYFQKKTLYIIRKFKMIQNNDKIAYKKTSDFRDLVLEDILEMFAEKANIELIRLPSKKTTNKIAISSTVDSESDEIVHDIIKGTVKDLKKTLPVIKKTIKPLYLFLDKEVLLYAKLKNLKFKNKKNKQDKIQMFLNDLEKKHPEIKQAIVKGCLKITVDPQFSL